MDSKESVARFPLWVRIAIPIVGTVGMGVINWMFDYPLYGFMTKHLTARFGVVDGGMWTLAVMSVLSWIFSYAIIRYYDYTEHDWLGLEALKLTREMEIEPGKMPTRMQRLVRLGDVPAFLVLAIYDPVYSTLYLRKGKSLYNGFTARDWKIFNLSVVYANVLWTSGWLSAIEFIRFIPWMIEKLF
jgi:hypothetical protein